MQTQLKTKDRGKLRALELIALKLKQGVKYLDFEKELDKLLKTELPERDLETEGAWEHYNKGVEAGLTGK
jgi:hypothetical protein